MKNLSCAFTGHEPIRFPFGYDEEDELCLRIKHTMLLQILALYDNGVTDFYSDCGIGASMWGAELVLGLMLQHSEVRLLCVLPYEEQAKKWTPELRERYYAILEQSTDNHLINTHYTKDCRTRCSRYLVDRAGFLIAVYDNTEVVQLEPASQLIAYARKKGRGIIRIHPDTAVITPIMIDAG